MNCEELGPAPSEIVKVIAEFMKHFDALPVMLVGIREGMGGLILLPFAGEEEDALVAYAKICGDIQRSLNLRLLKRRTGKESIN